MSIIYRLEHKIKMFNKQTSVAKIFWDNENINELLYGGEILCHLQYINLSYFPCPDTNGSLIHNFPPPHISMGKF